MQHSKTMCSLKISLQKTIIFLNKEHLFSQISSLKFIQQTLFLKVSYSNNQVILIFLDLSAEIGGAFYVSRSSQLQCTNCQIQRISALQAGVVYIFDHSTLILKQCYITNNLAINHGVFRILSESNFTIEESIFEFNQVQEFNSIGQVIQVSSESVIKNSIFQKNSAFNNDVNKGGKGIEILQCNGNITISDCVFKDNLANISTPNIFLVNVANIVFDSCKFGNTQIIKSHSLIKDILGGFIQAISNTNVTVKECTFSRGSAFNGGAIYLIGGSSLFIQTSVFKENYAYREGGAIAADRFKNLIITEKCRFNSNNASYGDAIFAANAINSVQILKYSYFTHTQPSNFLFIQFAPILKIADTSFRLLDGKYDLSNYQESAVYIQESNITEIYRSTFENLVSKSYSGGGAIVIKETIKSKSEYNNIIISDCVFSGNNNTNGGALSLIDVSNITINGSTKFVNNFAQDMGGAIYFFCSDIGICNFTLKDTVFQDNQAQNEGGAIKWNYYEPKADNCKFSGNKAGKYGDSVASIANRIIQITPDQVGQKIIQFNNTNDNKLRSLQQFNGTINETDQQFSSLKNVQSGGNNINLIFAIVDKNGTIMRTHNGSSSLFISVITNKGEGNERNAFIESETKIPSQEGIFFVNNLNFVGKPNSTQRLQFTTDAIDPNIPENKGLEHFRMHILELQLRSCIDGEELRPDGKCVPCPPGQYLLSAPNNTQLCNDCDIKDKAECLGSNLIYPKPGYWRSSIYSENMIQCRNDEACIGRNPPENNLLGACNTGYQGVLCQECMIGYSKQGSNYKCSQCPSVTINSLRLIGIIALILLILFLIIRSSLYSFGQKKNNLSVFLRIMMNHLQLLTLTASFELEWPQMVRSYFSLMSPVSDVTTQFISIDCILDQRQMNSTMSEPRMWRIYYQKLIILAFTPIAIILIMTAVWHMIYTLKKKRQNRITVAIGQVLSKQVPNLADDGNINIALSRNQEILRVDFEDQIQAEKNGKIIAASIIVLFLLHPTITTIMFSAFNCENIDGIHRLYEDLEVICYQNTHTTFAFSVALPSLIIWGMGIPTLGLILIIKNSAHLQKFEFKSKYEFLYKGYRLRNAYFWEFMIIFRKLGIIFIQILLNQSGKIIQAQVTLLLLVIYITATAQFRPYVNHILNNLETISLISSAITVYCSVFYIANASFKADLLFSLNQESELLLFILIVGCNASFGFLWLIEFINQLRVTIRKNIPKVYLSLFFCCDKSKMEQEVQVEAFKERIEPFLDRIEKIQDYIKNKNSIYNQGLIPAEDEEFKSLINQLYTLSSQVESTLKKHENRLPHLKPNSRVSDQNVYKRRKSTLRARSIHRNKSTFGSQFGDEFKQSQLEDDFLVLDKEYEGNIANESMMDLDKTNLPEVIKAAKRFKSLRKPKMKSNLKNKYTPKNLTSLMVLPSIDTKKQSKIRMSYPFKNTVNNIHINSQKSPHLSLPEEDKEDDQESNNEVSHYQENNSELHNQINSVQLDSTQREEFHFHPLQCSILGQSLELSQSFIDMEAKSILIKHQHQNIQEDDTN